MMNKSSVSFLDTSFEKEDPRYQAYEEFARSGVPPLKGGGPKVELAEHFGSGDLADKTTTFDLLLSLQTACVRDWSGIPRFFGVDTAESPTRPWVGLWEERGTPK